MIDVAAEVRRRKDALRDLRDSGCRMDAAMGAGDPALRVCTCIGESTCECGFQPQQTSTAPTRQRYDASARQPSGLGICAECGVSTDGRRQLCEHCKVIRDGGALSASEARAKFLESQRNAHKRKVSAR